MSHIAVSRTLSFPVTRVWTALADFGGVHRYSAGVESSPINPGTPATGVGAERNCKLYDGNNIQERITEFVDNERLGIEVFQTSMPIKRAQVQFQLVSTKDSGCELSMTMDYTLKFGLVGKLMDAMMMKAAMTKSLARLLAALEQHLTTGEEIRQGWTPKVAA